MYGVLSFSETKPRSISTIYLTSALNIQSILYSLKILVKKYLRKVWYFFFDF